MGLRDAEERSQVTGIRHFHVYSMDDDTCNWPTDYSVRRSSRATLRSFCFKDSYPFLPLFTGILPTTDAVIVLTQLAKDPGADRSVSEISVLPQHFKMDEFIDWPIVSRNARTRGPVVKTRCKNLVGEPLTSLPPLTRLRRAPSSVVSFSLAVLRAGRRHCSAGTVSAENISARRSNPTSSRQSRQSGMPSVRQCGDTLTRRMPLLSPKT